MSVGLVAHREPNVFPYTRPHCKRLSIRVASEQKVDPGEGLLLLDYHGSNLFLGLSLLHKRGLFRFLLRAFENAGLYLCRQIPLVSPPGLRCES
jgi:hypothetical protein